MNGIHPFYEAHRPAMEAAMRQRLDVVDAALRERLALADTQVLRDEIMAEFAVVLRQMPYVGGEESRMSDFFMHLLGFLAMARVLRRHGLDVPQIQAIALASLRGQLLAVPEVERLETGRQFMSDANRDVLRRQAQRSRERRYPEDFVYDVVEPGPDDHFDFGIDYRSCGFCSFAARHGDREILPVICGLDFAAYDARGIDLERTQTLAGGASHCDFRFRLRSRRA